MDGPVLLLAVPGSGKTTVLVTRIGYLVLGLGVAPESILTMTYTVSAARDIKGRFAALFGPELADRLAFRTINGVCSSVIRRCERLVGQQAAESAGAAVEASAAGALLTPAGDTVTCKL